jgi:hypothetical protein
MGAVQDGVCAMLISAAVIRKIVKIPLLRIITSIL